MIFKIERIATSWHDAGLTSCVVPTEQQERGTPRAAARRLPIISIKNGPRTVLTMMVVVVLAVTASFLPGASAVGVVRPARSARPLDKIVKSVRGIFVKVARGAGGTTHRDGVDGGMSVEGIPNGVVVGGDSTKEGSLEGGIGWGAGGDDVFGLEGSEVKGDLIWGLGGVGIDVSLNFILLFCVYDGTKNTYLIQYISLDVFLFPFAYNLYQVEVRFIFQIIWEGVHVHHNDSEISDLSHTQKSFFLVASW